MGGSAAHFHVKICSTFAQDRWTVMGLHYGDPIQVAHVQRPSCYVSHAAPRLSEPRSGNVENLGTANYPTISGSENLVTFETQRLTPIRSGAQLQVLRRLDPGLLDRRPASKLVCPVPEQPFVLAGAAERR
jgi:hypothetical protein